MSPRSGGSTWITSAPQPAMSIPGQGHGRGPSHFDDPDPLQSFGHVLTFP